MEILQHPIIRRAVVRAVVAYEASLIVGSLTLSATAVGAGLYLAGLKDHFATLTGIGHKAPLLAAMVPFVGVALAIAGYSSAAKVICALDLVKQELIGETEEQVAARRAVRLLARVVITIAGLFGLLLGMVAAGSVTFHAFTSIGEPVRHVYDGSYSTGAESYVTPIIIGSVAGAIWIWPLLGLIRWLRHPHLWPR